MPGKEIDNSVFPVYNHTDFFFQEGNMKKTSKMIMMVLVVMMFLCISVSASAETVLQFGTTVNEQDSFQVAAEKFASGRGVRSSLSRFLCRLCG